MLRLNGCPSCERSLHYSSGWNEQLCVECGWYEGAPYEYKPPLVTWEEFQVLIPLLLQQYRQRKIPYEELYHIVTYEIRLKSVP